MGVKRSWHESGKLNMNHAAARALYGALILLILEQAQFGFRAHSGQRVFH